jgi:hypothetical protein
VVASLDSAGRLAPEQRRVLTDCVAELQRRRREPGLFASDPVAYERLRDLLVVARFVEIAADTDESPRHDDRVGSRGGEV